MMMICFSNHQKIMLNMDDGMMEPTTATISYDDVHNSDNCY